MPDYDEFRLRDLRWVHVAALAVICAALVAMCFAPGLSCTSEPATPTPSTTTLER